MRLVGSAVDGLQHEVGILVLAQALANVLEIQIGVDARQLLEVAAENEHRGVRKFPDRLPETAKLLVSVLRDLVADEEVVPRKIQAENEQRIAAMEDILVQTTENQK